MKIVDEMIETGKYGCQAIVAVAAFVVAVTAVMGALLYIPGWLIIEEGYYFVGAVYTIFVYGVAWRIGK